MARHPRSVTSRGRRPHRYHKISPIAEEEVDCKQNRWLDPRSTSKMRQGATNVSSARADDGWARTMQLLRTHPCSFRRRPVGLVALSICCACISALITAYRSSDTSSSASSSSFSSQALSVLSSVKSNSPTSESMCDVSGSKSGPRLRAWCFILLASAHYTRRGLAGCN